MNIERQVADYYAAGKLEDKIVGLLRGAGKNVEQIAKQFVSLHPLAQLN